MSARVLPFKPRFLELLTSRGAYTPDFAELTRLTEIPIFIYDSRKRGGSNHDEMEGSLYGGRAFTITSHWILKNANGVVAAFHAEQDSPVRHHVRGDLFIGSAEHVHVLDRRLGLRFNRQKIKIQLEDQTPVGAKKFRNLAWIEAFMYVGGRSSYWDNRMMNLCPVVQYKHVDPIRDLQFYEFDPFSERQSFFGRRGHGENRGRLIESPIGFEEDWDEDLGTWQYPPDPREFAE